MLPSMYISCPVVVGFHTALSYLGAFVLIVFVTAVVWVIAIGTHVFGVVRAAKRVHALLIDSILGATLRWLDQTPVSRVITRCTKDVKSVDGQFARVFRGFGAFSLPSTSQSILLNALARVVSVNMALITQLLSIALVTPAVILPGIAIFLMGVWVGNIYMQAQLPVKRDMSNKKAPVLGHFGAAISGLGKCCSMGSPAECHVLIALSQCRSARTALRTCSVESHTNASRTTHVLAGCSGISSCGLV